MKLSKQNTFTLFPSRIWSKFYLLERGVSKYHLEQRGGGGGGGVFLERESLRLFKVVAHNVSLNSLTCLKYPLGSSSLDLNINMNI